MEHGCLGEEDRVHRWLVYHSQWEGGVVACRSPQEGVVVVCHSPLEEGWVVSHNQLEVEWAVEEEEWFAVPLLEG